MPVLQWAHVNFTFQSSDSPVTTNREAMGTG
jgi:hypothetical protein